MITMLPRPIFTLKSHGPVAQVLSLFLISIAASSWMSLGVSFMNILHRMKWFPLCGMLLLVSGIIQLDPANLRCSLAHKGAYEAGVLHRDFSVGNIVIDCHGKGWLIDWDLSKPLSASCETPRDATRTVRFNIPPPITIKLTHYYSSGYLAIHVFRPNL